MSIQNKIRPLLCQISEGQDSAMVNADFVAFNADSLIGELAGALAFIDSEQLTDDEADVVHDALCAYRKWRDE